ncbi:MAG: hypothetical protein ACI4SI_09525, partial [Candidatus Ornithospirochaeta sp.]
MKKTIKLASILLLVMMVVVSCSPEKTMDGKTAETKKQMTSTEYSENRGAIQSVSVVEAYAVANQDEATPFNRGLKSGEYKLSFKETTTITKDSIVSKLKEKIGATSVEAEKAFYNSLIASLNKAPDVKVKGEADSYVNFRVDEKGIAVVSSLDITIIIDDKEIEIEKDADDKWIEIDGTFFDDTELEKMLDAAEDAAEVIEELFKSLNKIIIDFSDPINGYHQEFNFVGKDGAVFAGSLDFKIEDNMLSTSFDFKYTEYEDDGETVDEEFNIKASLKLNIKL